MKIIDSASVVYIAASLFAEDRIRLSRKFGPSEAPRASPAAPKISAVNEIDQITVYMAGQYIRRFLLRLDY